MQLTYKLLTSAEFNMSSFSFTTPTCLRGTKLKYKNSLKMY